MSKEAVTGIFVIAAAVVAGLLGRGPIRFKGPLHVVVSPTNWFTSSSVLVAEDKAAEEPPPATAPDVDVLGPRIAALETARARDDSGSRIAALEATVRAPRATNAPSITERDVEVLSTRVASLQQTVGELRELVEGAPAPEPINIPTALAAEGLPVDSPVGLKSAKAVSTDSNRDADGKPLYDPAFAIDGNPDTRWVSRQGETTTAWIDVSLDQYRRVTGIRFLTHPTTHLTFGQATIVFDGRAAQKIQLTERQRGMTGWFYFPLQSVDAGTLRILFNETRQPQVIIAEIEIYGE